jgi:hypothetical protein
MAGTQAFICGQGFLKMASSANINSEVSCEFIWAAGTCVDRVVGKTDALKGKKDKICETDCWLTCRSVNYFTRYKTSI